MDNSDVIKKNFLNNNTVAKLIDFIIAKESPLYKGDDRNENNTKGKFGN